MNGWIWLLIGLVFAVVEVVNLAFFAVFAALGAFGAAIAAAAGASTTVQIVVFAAVSVGGVAVARRPIVHALGPRRGLALRSGVSGLVGQRGTVVKPVTGTDTPGCVHVRGEDWPAITYDPDAIGVGQTVEVLDVESTKLVVTAQ